MAIDSHHHFWRYSPAEYPWIDESKAILRRDFLPQDQDSLPASKIEGIIVVQSRSSVEDTRWLLELATGNQTILGVVGWAPLASDLIGVELEGLAKNTKLRGLRHDLQSENDEYMLREDFNRGIAHLKNFSLRYDLLIAERQLSQALRFVDLHPSQIFIVDHLAKPKIKDSEMEPWSRLIKQLSLRHNVYCKVSGMVTEADWRAWTSRSLRPYFDVVLEAFGPRRLMAGSDWPVCLLACGYQRWFDIMREWAASLSETEQERIFSGTATEAYGLK